MPISGRGTTRLQSEDVRLAVQTGDRAAARGRLARARSSRRCLGWAAAVTAAATLLGCGGDSGAPSGPPEDGGSRVIRGTVDLGRPASGPPDAGTAAGHGADAAVGSTSDSSFPIRGTVDPPDSEVTLVNARTRGRGDVDVDPEGRFTAIATDLRPGSNAFVIEGRKPGYRSWRLDVRIDRETEGAQAPGTGGAARFAASEEGMGRPATVVTRRPGTVRVPSTDATPPEAFLRVEWEGAGGRRGAVESSSGGKSGEVPPTTRADVLWATAVARDADAGVARVRLSIQERIACVNESTGERYTEPRLRDIPPAAIERTRVAPGTLLPTERRREVRLELRRASCSRRGRPTPGCRWVVERVTGGLRTDATSAHELEASSAPVRFYWSPSSRTARLPRSRTSPPPRCA